MNLSWMARPKSGLYYLMDRGIHTGLRIFRCRPTPGMTKYQLWGEGVEGRLLPTLTKAKEALVSHYRTRKEAGL